MDGGMTLLEQAAEAGLTVSIGPSDKLIVKGPRRAEETAKLILQHKAVVIPAYWRRLYRDRLSELQAGREPRVAERMAWEAVATIWHRAHGEHPAANICAGCGLPISGSTSLSIIPDKTTVHLDDGYNCLVRFGQKWRYAAALALLAYGVPAPVGDPL